MNSTNIIGFLHLKNVRGAMPAKVISEAALSQNSYSSEKSFQRQSSEFLPTDTASERQTETTKYWMVNYIALNWMWIVDTKKKMSSHWKIINFACYNFKGWVICPYTLKFTLLNDIM